MVLSRSKYGIVYSRIESPTAYSSFSECMDSSPPYRNVGRRFYWKSTKYFANVGLRETAQLRSRRRRKLMHCSIVLARCPVTMFGTSCYITYLPALDLSSQALPFNQSQTRQFGLSFQSIIFFLTVAQHRQPSSPAWHLLLQGRHLQSNPIKGEYQSLFLIID